MAPFRTTLLVLSFLFVPTVKAGGGPSRMASPGTGKVTLTLVNDAPALGIEEVNLKVAGVDIKQPNSEWFALPLVVGVPPVGVRDLTQGDSWPVCFRVPALGIQATQP